MTASLNDGFRYRHVAVAGSLLHVVEAGDPDGVPFLFLHGWPESWQSWRQVMTVAARQARPVAIDLPGVGESSGAATDGSKRQLAAMVHELIATLGLRDVRSPDPSRRLTVLRRQIARPKLQPADRALLAALSRALPRSRWSCFFVKPRPTAALAPAAGRRRVDLPAVPPTQRSITCPRPPASGRSYFPAAASPAGRGCSGSSTRSARAALT